MRHKLRDEWSKSPTLAEDPADGHILSGMNSAIPVPGPFLADHSGVPTPDQAERWYRARATAAYMSAIRGKLAWIIPLDIFIVGLLAFIGYPLPRVLGIALTGGVRSPLLPTILIPFSDLVIKNGWSRMAKTILVLIAGGLFALIVLPAPWFGPDVPQPAYWILLLAILITAGAWHTRYALVLTRTIGDSACQLGRAREEVVYRAVARAREMEQIGLKLSHELKNPLAAIKGLVQLSARAACDPDSAEQLRVVAAEVDRMESILKEYLSFSRPLESLQPQRMALGALADEVLSLMDARAASAGIALRRRGDAIIEADPRRLKDALFNLVGNAVEATPEGGKVEVEIDEIERSARIAVRDSGRGMPPEVLDRIGTPFFTTRDEGTGLGVVVARAAFAQHGGSLVYSSEPGRETTAVGTLPLRSAQRSNDGAGAAG